MRDEICLQDILFPVNFFLCFVKRFSVTKGGRMRLRELIREIRRRKGWTQIQLAAYLRTNQQNVQGMENAGANLEKQFALFLRLLPLCDDLGIDPAGDPESVAHTEKETLRYVQRQVDSTTGKPHPRPTRRHKKKAVGPVSSSRIEGDYRK